MNVAKYAFEFTLVEDECYPNDDSDGKDPTCRWDDIYNCDKQYQVCDFYVVGGYYGATNEELMMREIMSHGPVTSVLNVPSFFQMYKEGIIQSDCDPDISDMVISKDKKPHRVQTVSE